MNLKKSQPSKLLKTKNLKFLLVQCSEYDYTVASLIEGLHELKKIDKDIEFKCVDKSNYANYYNDYTIKEENIGEYLEGCDFIVTTSNRWVRYDIVQNFFNKKKIIFVDGADTDNFQLDPNVFTLYFKREVLKSKIDKELKNIVPFPFAAEKRYFSKNIDKDNICDSFEKIWDNKTKDLCCLLSADANRSHRFLIKEAVNSVYSGKDYYIGESVSGGTSTGIDSVVGKLHNDQYYNVLRDTKISVDAWGAGKWTGRLFESMANCCLLFHQPLDDLCYQYEFIVDKDIIFYYNIDDLLVKIDYYINNQKEAKDIAYNGFKKLLNYHTSLSRAKFFVNKLREFV